MFRLRFQGVHVKVQSKQSKICKIKTLILAKE